MSLRLYEITIESGRGGDHFVLWLIDPAGAWHNTRRPFELYFEVAGAGPTRMKHAYYGRDVSVSRATVTRRFDWFKVRKAYKDTRTDVSWLGLAPEEAYLLQQGLQIGDHFEVDPGGNIRATGLKDPSLLPNLGVLSFDTETTALHPGPGERLLTIAMVHRQGDGEPTRIVLQLGSVSSSNHPLLAEPTIIQRFGTVEGSLDDLDKAERNMLRAWAATINELDPHIIVAHNLKFDLMWILARWRALFGDGDNGPPICKGTGGPTPVRIYDARERRGGKVAFRADGRVDGRLMLDTLTWSQAQYGKRDCSLAALVRRYVDPAASKDPMPYRLIVPSFLEGPAGRAKLAGYCLQDADLLDRYKQARRIVAAQFSQSNLTHMSMSRNHVQKNQAMIYCTICHYALGMNMFVPWVRWDRVGRPEKYEGGKVFETTPGLHAWVWTLDFKSLYPSIMRRYNLGPDTLVPPDEHKLWQPDAQIHVNSEGNAFLLPNVRPSTVLKILESYNSKRNEFKAQLKTATGDDVHSLKGAEQACKLVSNAMYGMFGATMEVGAKLPCNPVATAVTCAGREAIGLVKKIVHERWGDIGVVQVGGDTDSVIIKASCIGLLRTTDEWHPFHAGDPANATDAQVFQAMGRAMVREINRHFVLPMEIEDDHYFRWLYYTEKKKRYVGALVTVGPDGELQPAGLQIKGFEAVRQDSAAFIRDAQLHAFTIIMERPPEPITAFALPARQFSRDQLADWLEWVAYMVSSDAFPNEAYLLENELKRDPSDYAGDQQHAVVALAMRDEGLQAEKGDRIRYILVEGERKGKAAVVPAHPGAVAERGLPIARRYYLELYLKMVQRAFGQLLTSEQLAAIGRTRWRKSSIPQNSMFAAFKR